MSATPVKMVVVGYQVSDRLTYCTRFRLPTCTAPMIQSSVLFHIFPFSVLVRVASSRCPCSLPPYVRLLCTMRTLYPWDQQYPFGSRGTYSLVIVSLGGLVGYVVPCVLASSAFVVTRDFTCATSAVLVSTNFLFMAIRSATMLRSDVAASVRLSSDVAVCGFMG